MIKKSVYLEAAPAKINLFLDIQDKREDQFHELKTLFQAISLQDYLTFELLIEFSEEDVVIDDLDFELSLDSNSEELRRLGPNNIIVRVIETFFVKLPDRVLEKVKAVNIDVFVDKNIPIEAGLAGGSSNAAATTLRALNKFFFENLDFAFSHRELSSMALEIGSDVPFCLHALDTPQAYAESRGERFTEPNFNFNFNNFSKVILVKPKFGISTAKAFDLVDNKNLFPSEAIDGFYNRFEDVILDEYPQLR